MQKGKPLSDKKNWEDNGSGSLFDRLVLQRRRGYCYLLNGLFAALLQELGYEPVLHNARILFGSDQLFPRGQAMMTLELDGTTWLLHVGYRNGLIEPIPLIDGFIAA